MATTTTTRKIIRKPVKNPPKHRKIKAVATPDWAIERPRPFVEAIETAPANIQFGVDFKAPKLAKSQPTERTEVELEFPFTAPITAPIHPPVVAEQIDNSIWYFPNETDNCRPAECAATTEYGNPTHDLPVLKGNKPHYRYNWATAQCDLISLDGYKRRKTPPTTPAAQTTTIDTRFVIGESYLEFDENAQCVSSAICIERTPKHVTFKSGKDKKRLPIRREGGIELTYSLEYGQFTFAHKRAIANVPMPPKTDWFGQAQYVH